MKYTQEIESVELSDFSGSLIKMLVDSSSDKDDGAIVELWFDSDEFEITSIEIDFPEKKGSYVGVMKYVIDTFNEDLLKEVVENHKASKPYIPFFGDVFEELAEITKPL